MEQRPQTRAPGCGSRRRDERRRVELPGVRERPSSELADRLEEPEADLGARARRPARATGRSSSSSSPSTASARLSPPGTTTAASSENGAREDAEPSQDDARGVGDSREWLHSIDRSIVWWRSSTVRGPLPSTPKASVRPDEELRRAEELAPRRGQLDGERDAVEPVADRHDVADVVVAQREVARTHRARSTNSRTASDSRARGAVSPAHRRETELRYAPAQLAGHVERCSTGREQRDVGPGAKDGVGRVGAGVHDVLAVVEDEQRPLRGEPAGHAAEAIDAVLGERQDPADGRGQQLRVGDLDEIDPPHAVRERVDELGTDLLREAGLARSPGPISVTSRLSCTSRTIVSISSAAPDERRQGHREVVRHGVERAQGWEHAPRCSDGRAATRAPDGRGPSAGACPGRAARRRPAARPPPGRAWPRTRAPGHRGRSRAGERSG